MRNEKPRLERKKEENAERSQGSYGNDVSGAARDGFGQGMDDLRANGCRDT